MSDNIEKLTETLNEFITESAVRAVRLETNQEHLTKAVTEMSAVYLQVSKSNIRLEEKIVSLEGKALDRLTSVETAILETNSRVDSISSKVCKLEVFNANLKGKDEIRSGTRKFWSDNGMKILVFVCTAATVLGVVYSSVIKSNAIDSAVKLIGG